MSRLRRLLATLLLAGCLLAPTAVAQEEGVIVDPDTPSGKEYAIPLEAARRTAAGDNRTGRPVGDRSAPLFGVGVTVDDAPRRSRPKATSSDRSKGGRDARTRSGAEAREPSAQLPPKAALEVTDGGLETMIAVAGITALVLGAGLLGGVALRRRVR